MEQRRQQKKRDLGELWAARSGGQCLFVMPQGREFGAIGQRLLNT